MIEQYRSALESYQPNPDALAELRHSQLIALIGPVAVGKTTVMDALHHEDSDFGIVQSFTTRDPRAGEQSDLYRFLPHTQATINALTEELQQGTVVQSVVHPTTGRVYGSTIQDYAGSPYSMLDMMPVNVDHMRALPFGAYTEVALVASPEIWQKRFETRTKQLSRAEASQRIAESLQSLSWAYTQQNMLWVANDEAPHETATLLRLAVREGYEEPSAKKVGGELLKLLKAL